MDKFINIKSDVPCNNDLLGFDKYIETIMGIVLDQRFKTPFCIGVYGKWGTGKTSFMQLLRGKFWDDNSTPYTIPVWFNPWRYEKEDHLIIPFLKTIEQQIKSFIESHKTLAQQMREGLVKSAQKIGRVATAFAYGLSPELTLGPMGFKFDITKMVAREAELEGMKIDETAQYSDEMLSVYYNSVSELKSAVCEENFRIAVFIDDLDRCLPEKAIELLEAIKLFLDVEGYLFVIGVDKEIVKMGIYHRYQYLINNEDRKGENYIISPEDYLEKIIQLPIDLPPIEPSKKIEYIKYLIGDDADFRDHAELIGFGVGENPRSLKRFINLLSFTVRLAEEIKKHILSDESSETSEHKKLINEFFIPEIYVKWTIIAFRFHEIYNDIKGNKMRLIELQTAAAQSHEADETVENGANQPGIHISGRFKKVLNAGKKFPTSDWLISLFVHLSLATDISAKKEEISVGYEQLFKPGDMVRIPKGKFLYGPEKEPQEIKNDYFIDVFPVTNKQYKEYLDDRKEQDVPYLDESWAEPFNWDKDSRTYPNGSDLHPVVLVSIKDAIAFCTWRSMKEGNEIRLPSEKEWEKAARGEDGRKYPWGDRFDAQKCNSLESGINTITNVTYFQNGKSPYQCHDMSGNTWEWTSSFYDQEYKVLRGGSWKLNQESTRCAYREGHNPDARISIPISFRCVRVK